MVTSNLEKSKNKINNSFYSGAEVVYSINTYQNGISVTLNRNILDSKESLSKITEISPYYFDLRLKDTKNYSLLKGKTYLYKDNYEDALWHLLSNLHKEGLLKKSAFFLGTVVDPFTSFSKKFDVTIKCLDLLEQFKPGVTIIQTRAPMAISAIAMFKMMSENLIVSISLESFLESSIKKYTPTETSVKSRIMLANSLMAQSIKVNLSVSPILPYGDYNRGAWDFADLLVNNSDYITLGSLSRGKKEEENQLKNMPLAKKLERDKKYKFLRPDAHSALEKTLKEVSPDKLDLPLFFSKKKRQLSLFEAA